MFASDFFFVSLLLVAPCRSTSVLFCSLATTTVAGEYLPDVVHVVFADLRESEQPDDLHVAPEIILANLKRLRLRHGIRVTDVQDLTKSQPDGKLTIAEFRLLLHKARLWRIPASKPGAGNDSFETHKMICGVCVGGRERERTHIRRACCNYCTQFGCTVVLEIVLGVRCTPTGWYQSR